MIKGADVNAQANTEYIALNWITERYNLNYTKLLIEAEANFDYSIIKKFQEYHTSKSEIHDDLHVIIDVWFEAHSSDVVTALLLTSCYGHTDVAELLI